MRFLVFFIVIFLSSCVSVYEKIDSGYQAAQDPVRIDHIKIIRGVVTKYIEKTGKMPLHDMVLKEGHPFIVYIGRSERQEDKVAQLEVMKKAPGYINSNLFESILSQGIGSDIKLPRDPQLVGTFAPNVYIYFVAENQFCVAGHLYSKTKESVKYTWEGGTFYSHTYCYSKDTLDV